MKYLFILIIAQFTFASVDYSQVLEQRVQSSSNSEIRNHPDYDIALDLLSNDFQHLIEKPEGQKWVFHDTKHLSNHEHYKSMMEKINDPGTNVTEAKRIYIEFLNQAVLSNESQYNGSFSTKFLPFYDKTDSKELETLVIYKIPTESLTANFSSMFLLSKSTIEKIQSVYCDIPLSLDSADLHGVNLRILGERLSSNTVFLKDFYKKIGLKYIYHRVTWSEDPSDFSIWFVGNDFSSKNIVLFPSQSSRRTHLKKDTLVIYNMLDDVKEIYRSNAKNFIDIFFKSNFDYWEKGLQSLWHDSQIKAFIESILLSSSNLEHSYDLRSKEWLAVVSEVQGKYINEHEKESIYQNLINSLSSDLSTITYRLANERWIFNYNNGVKLDQYQEQVKLDGGGLSPSNKLYQDLAKGRVDTFYENHIYSGGDGGNGLYFFIEPATLAEDFTNKEAKIGMLLKLPKGSKVVDLKSKNFLSEKTVSLVRQLFGISKEDSDLKVSSLKELLRWSKKRSRAGLMMSHVIYSVIKELGIDILQYSYRDSKLLKLNAGVHSSRTAFVLINRSLINDETTVFYDIYSLDKFPDLNEIQVLKKVSLAKHGEELGEVFWPNYLESSPQTPEDEINKIFSKYFFTSEELKPLWRDWSKFPELTF